MIVTVMYRNNYFGGDGWVSYPVVIEIADTCPICGGPRGEPTPHIFHEDGDWYSVSVWSNPCNHFDSYKDCLIESGYAAKLHVKEKES